MCSQRSSVQSNLNIHPLATLAGFDNGFAHILCYQRIFKIWLRDIARFQVFEEIGGLMYK